MCIREPGEMGSDYFGFIVHWIVWLSFTNFTCFCSLFLLRFMCKEELFSAYSRDLLHLRLILPKIFMLLRNWMQI